MYTERSANALIEHAHDVIKRREPAITKLVKTFNELCAKLEHLVTTGSAPAGAVIPLQLESRGIFDLQIDDPIWNDLGLDEFSTAEDAPPPLWLASDDVRKGIKALLMLDRCIEEETRLRNEALTLQAWLLEEWLSVQKAKVNAGKSFLICCETC